MIEEYDIEKMYADIATQVQAFAEKHPGETFYAFAIDAGLLCLNSEEKFAKTLEEYKRNWQERNSKQETIEDLDEFDLEDYRESYGQLPGKLPEGSKIPSFEEYVTYLLNQYNKFKAEEEEDEENPYDGEEQSESLRYNTGDWAYQGFGEINYVGTRSMYDEHYGMSDGEQENSEYNQLVKDLLQKIEQNKKELFAPLNLTNDFRLINAKHIY